MKKLLLLFIISFSISTFSQENQLSKFQKNLILVKNIDSLKTFTNEIQNIQKFNTKDIIPSINQSTKWKLICYKINGWNEIVGQQKTQVNRIFVSNNKDNLTTEDVLKIFDIKYNDSIFLKNVPLVYEREDFFNRKTTPIVINNQYLLLRYVHSYPNGNQTSWYTETNYYFKKE
ncbi:hypothetical protein [Flavobacterium sp.]|uniref:hypothetical protein n=1 Tax=Flavobacterium sp. TaxID=239 RepID=UPI0037521B33